MKVLKFGGTSVGSAKNIRKVIEIVKRVRTKTDIGLNPLSVSGLSLNLVKNQHKWVVFW